RVWPADELPKEIVSNLIPGHRNVTAPMGTVFPVTAHELAALHDELYAGNCDLEREAEPGHSHFHVVPFTRPMPQAGPIAQPGAFLCSARAGTRSTHPPSVGSSGVWSMSFLKRPP